MKMIKGEVTLPLTRSKEAHRGEAAFYFKDVLPYAQRTPDAVRLRHDHSNRLDSIQFNAFKYTGSGSGFDRAEGPDRPQAKYSSPLFLPGCAATI